MWFLLSRTQVGREVGGDLITSKFKNDHRLHLPSSKYRIKGKLNTLIAQRYITWKLFYHIVRPIHEKNYYNTMSTHTHIYILYECPGLHWRWVMLHGLEEVAPFLGKLDEVLE